MRSLKATVFVQERMVKQFGRKLFVCAQTTVPRHGSDLDGNTEIMRQDLGPDAYGHTG